MKFNFESSVLSFVLFTCLITMALCGTAQIVQQIDAKTLEKQGYVSQKDDKLLSLQQAADTQKTIYQEWVQAKLGPLDAYRQFYLENLRCQSLSPQFKTFYQRGTIPDGCLPAAATSQTLPYIVRKLILADAQFNSTTSRAILESYGLFKNDAQAYNNTLRKLSFQPINRAQKKFIDCMSQYASQSNQHPSQCSSLMANLYRIVDIQQQKYISPVYGPYQTTLFYIISNNTYNLNQTSQAYKTQFEKQGDVTAADVSSKYPICQTGLQSLKTSANIKLNAAYAVNAKIIDIKAKIIQIETALDGIIQKAKTTTNVMYGLLEQLKQLPA